MNTFREFAHTNKALYMVISTTSINEDNPEFIEVSKNLFGLFDKMLESLKLSNEKQIHIIRWIRSMVHGFIILELQSQFEIPVTVNETYNYMIETTIEVLKSKRKI